MSGKGGRDAAGKGESLSDMLAKCESVARHLGRTAKHAILSRTVIDAANSDRRLLDAFQDTLEAQTFAVVRFSLMQSLLMQTVRCWDRPKDDRASLPHLADLLREPELADALIERATRRTPGMGPVFRDRLAGLRRDIRKHSFGEREKRRCRVVSYRDHFIAHSLTLTPAIRAVDSDVCALLDETARLVEEAHSIVFGRDLALDEWHRLNAEYARRFWASVRAGQIVNLGRQRDWAARRAAWSSASD